MKLSGIECTGQVHGETHDDGDIHVFETYHAGGADSWHAGEKSAAVQHLLEVLG